MKNLRAVLLAGLLVPIFATPMSFAATKNPSVGMPIADKANAGPVVQRRTIHCNTAASPQWCAGGFVAHCDHSKGGLSTNPDGSITCTIN